MNPYRIAGGAMDIWPAWVGLAVVSTGGYLAGGWKAAIWLPFAVFGGLWALILLYIYTGMLREWLGERAVAFDAKQSSKRNGNG